MNLSHSEIEICVEQLIEEYDLDSIPINLELLSEKTEVSLVEYSDADSGICGALVCNNNEFSILYSTKLNNVGRHRFSIAHEFGHYFLPGHPEAVLKDGNRHESKSNSSDPFEKEADYFATCLLMPRKSFIQSIETLPYNIDSISKISNMYMTSLTSTALRYVHLSSEAVSVIISKDGKILYSKHSEPMKLLGNFWKSFKGQPIPTASLSSSIEMMDKPLSNIGSLNDWVTCDLPTECREEVLDLGSYGKRLSFIVALN